MLNLRGIDAHDRRFRSENEGQRDVLPNQARQHPLQAADRLVEVDVLREKHLLPAEGEQLLRERSRAPAGLLNLDQVRPIRIAFHVAIEQQLRVPQNRRQQVVEVVRDAASEPADAFNLLGLNEPPLEHPPVRHIADDMHRCRSP